MGCCLTNESCSRLGRPRRGLKCRSLYFMHGTTQAVSQKHRNFALTAPINSSSRGTVFVNLVVAHGRANAPLCGRLHLALARILSLANLPATAGWLRKRPIGSGKGPARQFSHGRSQSRRQHSLRRDRDLALSPQHRAHNFARRVLRRDGDARQVGQQAEPAVFAPWMPGICAKSMRAKK
jgi:hypothetical protein